MKIFFSVGEPSGDQHAAHLIHELRQRRPDLEFEGYGGPLMERAGCRLDFQLTDLAVMGIWRVIPLLWRFLSLARMAGRMFRESPPDAVVLVDFPGFNWWIARQAKAAGIPVFYYMPPQLWAWASWRVKKVRRFVDCVLSALPFERDWYAERGVTVDYVGHPFFDEVAQRILDGEFIESLGGGGRRVVGVLPGSRDHEVSRCFPVMLEIIEELTRRHANLRFAVACYKESHRAACGRMLAARATRLPVELFVGRTSEVIEAAECCLMVSGSVSLELLARETPAAVMYRTDRITYLIGRALVSCKFMSLPNLMAERAILPEYLIVGNPAAATNAITGIVDGWLADGTLLSLTRRELKRLKSDVVAPGATSRAATAILARMASAMDAPAPAHRSAA
ncbi:MAG: lipid-A-disaccharide synthase [Planctomycetaceae bacterium]